MANNTVKSSECEYFLKSKYRLQLLSQSHTIIKNYENTIRDPHIIICMLQYARLQTKNVLQCEIYQVAYKILFHYIRTLENYFVFVSFNINMLLI